MKKTIVALGLMTSLVANLFAGDTLRLKLEPEREFLLSGSPQEVVVKIDLTAAGRTKKLRRMPLNLAVVLDRSGSMTGAKIEKARQSAMGLVDQLAPGDIFSLIAYSDHAEVLVAAQELGDKEAVKSRISCIRPGGSTALYAGVELGASQIQRHFTSRRINRVILLSDGLANVGPSSTRDLRRLGRDCSERGISVTTIGVGDDYNEDLMASLAEASDANYYYVKDTEKLPEVFAKELGGLVTVAAREVRIEIRCSEGVRPIGLIGRPEAFVGQSTSVHLSQLALEQNRYLFLRCLVKEPQPEVAAVTVRYIDELNGGAEQVVSERARVRFTADETVAARSERAAIVAQKELLLTAVAKDDALAAADAGRYKDAAQTLGRQAIVLDRQVQNAPAPVQLQLRQEAENLRRRAYQLEQDQYDSGLRKSMQSESWNYRNSK
jgi:Ca-activated chloride channel family protein